jgi:3-dehydroquinate synthase
MLITADNYTIHISSEFNKDGEFGTLFSNNNYGSIFVLADEHTQAFCYPIIKNHLPPHQVLQIQSGESEKNIETCKYLWQCLTDFQAERKSLLINLGGGVIGDMGGFVAGTFKRGFDFVNIPTTLLSQVDASVGGKLGIDFNGIKNLIGLFQQPKVVFICPQFLKTLPFNQLRSGFSEVIKHGLIYDADYYHACKVLDIQQHNQWETIIGSSVKIKNEVVQKDPFEKGLRKILNFGHTIGHAVETWSLHNDVSPLLHGEAIAIGMICEAWLSFKVNGLSEHELSDISNTFIQLFGKYPLQQIPLQSIMEVMQLDKKNSNQSIRFSLLNSIGSCDFDLVVSDQLIAEAIQYYYSLS